MPSIQFNPPDSIYETGDGFVHADNILDAEYRRAFMRWCIENKVMWTYDAMNHVYVMRAVDANMWNSFKVNSATGEFRRG